MGRRSSSSPGSSSTFWPLRPVGPQPIKEDRYCEKCGYNLRGLLPRGRCPECGKRYGALGKRQSTLPWPRRRAMGALDAYGLTVWMVLRHPQQLGEEALVEGPLSYDDGHRFRWITVGLAFAPLMLLFFLAARSVLTDDRRLILFSLGAAFFLLLWLDGMTLRIVDLFAGQNLPADDQDRLVTLSQYTCAALLLSWVHPVGLLVVQFLMPLPNPLPSAMAVAAWAFLALVQWGLWLAAPLGLAKGSMDVTPEDMIQLALRVAAVWIVYSLWYLLVLPAALYWMAHSMLHII